MFANHHRTTTKKKTIFISNPNLLKQHQQKKNSGQIDQEAAPGRGALDGESAGRRQAGAGVHLFAARRERVRLEVDPGRHHAGELYQFDCV